MRIVMAAVGAVFVGLLAVGVLGVASAETTPSGSSGAGAHIRTVSVEGVATASIAPAASEAEARSAYREAMAAAIVDGKEKAQFLSEKAGAAVGPVDSVAEGGGYISCPSEEEYAGAEPDFGSGASVYAAAPGVSPAVRGRAQTPPVRHAQTPPVRHARKPKRRRRQRRSAARAAAVQPCTLSTHVALVYELS
ncbi:MAG: hypothetical protein ACYCUM_04600 [Solirubrobacteraceae bacterium]